MNEIAIATQKAIDHILSEARDVNWCHINCDVMATSRALSTSCNGIGETEGECGTLPYQPYPLPDYNRDMILFQNSLPYFSVTILLVHIGIVSMCTNHIQSMFFNN